MKTFLLSTLFLACSLSFHAANEYEEKTYNIKINWLTLHSVDVSWYRTDGLSDNDNDKPYTLYYGEYGIKGFERGEGIIFTSTWNGWSFNNLIPDTEYSFYIRSAFVSEDSPVWFEEYNFKTIACNTEISNIKEYMIYANGQSIKDLIDVYITCDKVDADSYELEYGIKGFEHGSGTMITPATSWSFYIGNANLQSNTEYDYYVRAKCNGVYGKWSEKKSFTTTDVFHYLGSEAFDVSFENITNKSAIAEWRRITGGAPKYYLIEYGPKGFERGKGQTKSVLLNSFEFFGLEPDTEYSFFIRSNGTSSTDPVWFDEHTFKTHPCNTEISGVKIETVYALCGYSYLRSCSCGGGGGGFVAIMWDDMADSYEFEYGLKGFQIGTGEIMEVKERNGVSFFPSKDSDIEYDFYIRAECAGEFGEWSSVNSFFIPKYVSITNVQSSNFEVFPNPVEDVLNINFNSAFDLDNIVVSIFDLTGSIRYKSGYREYYNVSSLPAGTYIVSIRDKKLSETTIIQKK